MRPGEGLDRVWLLDRNVGVILVGRNPSLDRRDATWAPPPFPRARFIGDFTQI